VARPKAIDLFCGCGGLTEGLRQAGFSVVGALDSEPLAVESYRFNHPRTALWSKDIRRVAASGMMNDLGLSPGDLDLLAGCPPCQAFSGLRTLNGARGIRDSDKDLLFEFLRFVRVLRPRALMMENVPGLADDRRMAKLLKALRSLGYTCEYKILDAADYGVAQRRRRLILLAGKNGAIAFAKAAADRVTVRDAIGSLARPGKTGDELHDFPEKRQADVVDLIARIPKNGGSRLDLGDAWQLQCHKKCDGFSDVYGRMSWGTVAPTITSGCVNPSKGRFLHPVQNRCITLREAALLQSFPVDYRFSLKRGKFLAAQMIGNALPPEFIRRQARAVIAYLADASHT
jgi:DNA (cytosine-5)-methyltransferase 1